MEKERLKDYQRDALASLERARKHGLRSALVLMATGLGKTVVSAFDADTFLGDGEGKVLLLCHDNRILRQDMEEFRHILGEKYSYGLYNCYTKASEARFLFASIKSVYLHYEEFQRDEFAYIVVDEAHHAPADMYQKVLRYFRPKFLLGMTATPNRLDGVSLKWTFGQTVYSLELPEAIQRGLLTKIDYRLVLDEMVDLDEDIDGNEIFIPKTDEEIADSIIEKRQDQSMLVFCDSIDHAEKMHRLLPDSGVVHSKRPDKQNWAILKAFKRGRISTIVSVDMLNEGVDIPHADTVVFLRSTTSPVVFYQQLGRGLRKYPGKECVTVYDFVGNVDRINIINKLVLGIKHFASLSGGVGLNNMKLKIEAKQFGGREISLDYIVQKVNAVSQKILLKKQLIEEVCQLSRDLGGRVPTEQEFAKDVWIEHDLETVYEQFENWDKFLIAAGFSFDVRKITNIELRAVLYQFSRKMLKTRKVPSEDSLMYAVGDKNFEDCIERYGSWRSVLDHVFKKVGLMSITDAANEAWHISYEQDGVFTQDDFAKIVGDDNVDLYLSYYGSWDNFIDTELISADNIELLHAIVAQPWPKWNPNNLRAPSPGEIAKYMPRYYLKKYYEYYGDNRDDRDLFIYHMGKATGIGGYAEPGALIEKERQYAWMSSYFTNNHGRVPSERELAEIIVGPQMTVRGYDSFRKKIAEYFGDWDTFLDFTRIRIAAVV